MGLTEPRAGGGLSKTSRGGLVDHLCDGSQRRIDGACVVRDPADPGCARGHLADDDDFGRPGAAEGRNASVPEHPVQGGGQVCRLCGRDIGVEPDHDHPEGPGR